MRLGEMDGMSEVRKRRRRAVGRAELEKEASVACMTTHEVAQLCEWLEGA
jgi:hypothetical protein